jgi:hypothetical protein
MNLGKFGEIWGRNFGESQNLGKSPKFQKKRGISPFNIPFIVVSFNRVQPETFNHDINIAYY